MPAPSAAAHPVPAPSASVEVLSRTAPRGPAGFTFIEVVFCMGIFAIGFLVVCMMLPAGTVIQRELETRADAAIIGKNSLQVMKAKGMHALTYEWIERLGGNSTYDANTYWNWGGLPGCTTSITALAAIFPTGTVSADMKDMEQVTDYTRHYVNGVYTPVRQLGAAVGWAPAFHNYWDTARNGGDIYSWKWRWMFSSMGGNWYSAMGPWHLSNDQFDHTNWGCGSIHCYKNRPIPGITPGAFTQGDFSYPSSVFDLSRRKYFSHIQLVNRNTRPGPGQPSNPDPTYNDWRVLAMTVAKPDDLSPASWNPLVKGWPEQVEWDVALPDQVASATEPVRHRGTPAANDIGPHWRMSNTGVDFRSQSAAGGDPNNGEPGLRGWVGRFNSRLKYWSGMGMNHRMWDYTAAGCNYFYGYPVRDSSQTAFDWRSAYVTPVPQDVLAIVYDKNLDLMLLRYPQAFAKTPDTSQGVNPRLDPAVFPTGANWVDRRLKVGDPMVTLNGGHVFRVKAVLDEVAAGATLPASRGVSASGGPMDWSDGTYQLVQVTPPIASTPINDNILCTNTDWPSPQDPTPYLYRVIVGTPPVTGGVNALQSVDMVPAGGTTAGGVMPTYDDLCN